MFVSASSKSLIHRPKYLLPLGLVGLMAFPETYQLTIDVLADAFWQVATYVAATLAVYSFLSTQFFSKPRFQSIRRIPFFDIIMASFLGALPGCGGAIVIITQYVQGKLHFGCVVAVLTATMGDAAFLLLSVQPKIGLMVAATGFVVGAISGCIVKLTHEADFLRPQITEPQQSINKEEELSKFALLQEKFWKWILIPAIVVALLGSLQFDVNNLFLLPEGSIEILGAILAISCMILWSITPDHKKNTKNKAFRVGEETNFVLFWVILSFILFELTIMVSGIDLAVLFNDIGLLVPLAAITIGFIPGCGPQILVTTLYIQGAIPLSAQLGNALSNDGDALFPAIAMAPKAALVATIYSAIPAIVVAYSYYYIFE